jgi:predicted ATPase
MKHVLTGGPGSGKSTVIEILKKRGFAVVEETARIVIQENLEKESDVFPWGNVQLFQVEVAKRQIESENKVKEQSTFLDRSVIDGYAYCLLEKVDIPQSILDHAPNQYDTIFFFEMLPNHSTDVIRRDTKEKAHEVHHLTKKCYEEFGYEVITVPIMNPEERADFILQIVREKDTIRTNANK